MSTKEKLIERFKSLPSDFTFDELVRLFETYGFLIDNKGKTSGSRVRFTCGTVSFICHRPHKHQVMKKATLRDVYNFLFYKQLL